MAIMRPDCDPSEITHDSERAVYQALRDQLPNGYVVFHSYPWLRPDRDLVLREGEADFVILNLDRGMLVLEVKGGKIDYRAPVWYRKRAAGWSMIKDPLEQAKRNMHSLNELIEEKTAGEVSTRDYVYGFAVVFPHHDYLGPTPNNADPVILITQPKMTNLAREIEAAFQRWTKTPRQLSARQWRAMLDALLPQFRLFRPVAGDLQSTYRQIKELTEGQVDYFRSIYGARRVYVTGVAGSGKTLLALDRALDFARQKKRTLMVCYNKELAVWLREQVERSPLDAECLEVLDILWFHKLASQLVRRAGLTFEVPRGEADVFWREAAPRLMEQAVLLLLDERDPRYDAIVVDEGQDFHTRWWECLNYCLLKGEDDGWFYAFADPNQSLWDWSMPEPPVRFSTPLYLDRNCRNTRLIARSSAHLASVNANVLPRSPQGRKPLLHCVPSRASVKGIVLHAVRDLLSNQHVEPGQLALVGAMAHDNGSLAGVVHVDGVPLTDSASAWRQGRTILVTTARSFKGLEADAVIVYDVGVLGDRFSLTDLYVACTRARTVLQLIIHDARTARQIQDAIDRASSEGGAARGTPWI